MENKLKVRLEIGNWKLENKLKVKLEFVIVLETDTINDSQFSITIKSPQSLTFNLTALGRYACGIDSLVNI